MSATTTVTGSSWAVSDGGRDEFTHRQFHVATDTCAVDDVSCDLTHEPPRVTD